MIDIELIVKVFKKHRKHMQSFRKSLDFNLLEYDRQINSLERLIDAGQERYKPRLRELAFKRSEALTKMADVEELILSITKELEKEEFRQHIESQEALEVEEKRGFFSS